MTTYAKIKKLGDIWGVRGQDLRPGQRVTVSKKNGETSIETVGQIVARFADGNMLATMVAKPKPVTVRYTPGDVPSADVIAAAVAILQAAGFHTIPPAAPAVNPDEAQGELDAEYFGTDAA